MSVESLESRLPQELQDRLGGFRRRLWRVKTAEGVFAALLGLALSYLAVFALDRFFDTSVVARVFLLLAGLAGFALFLPAKLHRWVYRCRSLVDVSRVLVQVQPAAGDRLLGIVELAEDEREQRASPRLVEAAIEQVAADTRDLDLRACVPNPRHRAWAWSAAVGGLVAVAAFAVPGAGSNALARWAFPWLDTPRYTFAQLDGVPARVVAAQGERFSLRLALAEDSAWSPQHASARWEGQAPIEAGLVDGAYVFEFPAQTRPGKVSVRVGDARESFVVDPLLRPELVSLNAVLTLPEYLGHPPREVDVRGGVVRAVEGSKVLLRAKISRSLAAAWLGDRMVAVEGDLLVLPEASIGASGDRELRWTDIEGLSSREPFLLHEQSVADTPPSIGVRDLPFEQVVLDTDVLTFKISADDDFGVREVGVEWNGLEAEEGQRPVQGEFVVARGGAQEASLHVDAAFCAQRLGVEPQALELRAYTTDSRPGAAREYSAVYRMYVLDAAQHMIWLTERLGDWQESVLEVRDQEERLYDRNRELRGLASDELDTEAMRQELARQAAAERANGRRLAALTDIGRDLIEDAIRNPEFNTATLENWAAMLEALEGLAKSRMPSVAELLAQASSAPTRSGAPPAESRMTTRRGQDLPPSSGSDGEESAQDPSSEGMPSAGNLLANQGGGSGTSSPPPTAPSVVDMVNGVDADPEMLLPPSGERPPPPPPSASGGKLGLAGTTMQGAPAPSGGGSDTDLPPAETPSQEALDAALAEQAALLAEFNGVMDQIAEILRNLQGSTFVKRLKLASRQESKLAQTLHQRVPKTFGVDIEEVGANDRSIQARMAGKQTGTSVDLRLIQDDLMAYFDRVQERKFATVSQEMDDSDVVRHLEQSSQAILANYTGEAVAEAEFWKDELDRWAEILVGPG